MPKNTFDIKGIKEITKALKKLEAKVQKKIIRKALRTEARGMQKEVKSRAPVGETGSLKKGVKLRAQKRSKKSIGMDILIDAKSLGLPSNHPAAVEYGTSKQDAQPHWRPAFDNNKDRLVSDLPRNIVRNIMQEIKKLKTK